MTDKLQPHELDMLWITSQADVSDDIAEMFAERVAIVMSDTTLSEMSARLHVKRVMAL